MYICISLHTTVMFFPLAMDLVSLRLHAKQLVKAGVRPSTARTYSSAQKRYVDFCAQYGLLVMPAEEDTLLLYVAYMHCCKLSVGTVKVYLSAIRSLHIEDLTWNICILTNVDYCFYPVHGR